MPGEQDQGSTGHIPGMPPANQQLANIPTVPSQEETVQLILSNQAREHDIRQQEIALEQAKVERAYNYAEKALVEQSAFFTREGGFRHSRYRWTVIAAVFVILLIVGFLVTLALTGHEALVRELCKDAVLLGGGGAGGYGAGRSRASQSQQQPATAPNPEG